MADSESGKRFPFISLEKAMERAKQLFDADPRGNEMSNQGAFSVWGYSEKSSGGFQTIGALRAYGLISGDNAGKVKLSRQAWDYFRDEREDVRAKALRQFALTPPFLKSLWETWGAMPPADTLARSHLKIERGLQEQQARSVLGIYKDNLAFANLKGNGTVSEKMQNAAGASDEDPPAVSVGDYVQWTSGGVDQFKPPRRVTKVHDGHVWVHGSPGAIPMSQTTVVAAPAPETKGGLSFHKVAQKAPERDMGGGADSATPDISVLLVGNRLQITADVDAPGLDKLKQVLDKYDEILKLLN